MLDYLITAAVAGLVALASIPLVRMLLLRLHVFDIPNHRSSHTAPVIRGAGLGCALGILAALILWVVTGRSLLSGLAACALAMACLGFIDDLKQLPALPRLILQLVTGAGMAVIIGSSSESGWFATWLVVAIVIGAVLSAVAINMVNFMDGINGITAITVIVWAGSAIGVGIRSGHPQAALVGAATGAVALAFLPFNFPHAKMFLGDGGSYLFGALVTAGVLMMLDVSWEWGFVTAAPMVLYAVDVAWALVRKRRLGKGFFEAHREHVFQRMVDTHHWSHVQMTLVMGLGCVLIALTFVPNFWVGVAATVVVSGLYLALPKLFPARVGETA